MGEMYNKTREQTEHLKRVGYSVAAMWECQWLPKYKMMCEEIKAEVIGNLKSRDSFFGGRTNDIKL